MPKGRDWAHQKRRKRWADRLRNEGPRPCARCGALVYHGDEWDLGHPEGADLVLGGDGYGSAPEHRRCNRSAGATLGNLLRQGKLPAIVASRDWWA